MSTGIETWNQNLLDIGAMYPFPGSEGLLAIIGIGTWIVWHVIQIRAENKTYAEDEELFSDKQRLRRAMHFSNAETPVEQLEFRRDNPKA